MSQFFWTHWIPHGVTPIPFVFRITGFQNGYSERLELEIIEPTRSMVQEYLPSGGNYMEIIGKP